MNVITEKQTLTPFFEHFFSEHPIENDVFVIEAKEKYFIFETDNVIDMIKNFSPEHQEHIKRQLQFYNFLNQDLTVCLVQIASDYIRQLIGNHNKMECKILPLHSINNGN
ncbi:hypothetical protein [Bacillus toyonensis]|uniref:hypothetical protein n=1 Tax=Bacillus toyonensis TaxID=155322 RepID=UPI001C0B45E2|nr:hypothetical protein [Bacillus toyonensis]MBU4642495.1 hypothetical protein [Bacillus toyonensis]